MCDACESVFAEVAYRPLGSNQDDAPRLKQLAAANAGVQAIRLLPGSNGESWLLKTPCQLANYTVLRGTPQTRIVQSITSGTGNPLMAGFYAIGTSLGNISVAANAIIGSRQLSISSSVAVGTYLQILRNAPSTGGFRQALYKVLAISGAGPFTVTLDRPVFYAFTAGDQIVINSPVIGICIQGNGMTMTGTGSRYLEFIQGVVNCCVSDINIDASAGGVSERLFSWDESSYNCHARGIVANAGNSAVIGFSFEGAEHCSFEDCTALSCQNPGFLFQDAVDCRLVNCQASYCGSGASFIAVNNTEGANYNEINGGDYSNNYVGIVLDKGSSYNLIVDANVYNNSTDGVQFAAGSFTLNDNRLRNVTVVNNNGAQGVDLSAACVGTIIEECVINNLKGVGIRVTAGSSATRILSCEVNTTGLGVESDCEIAGLRGTAPNTYIRVTPTGYARIRDLDVFSTANSSGNVIQVAGLATIENTHVTICPGYNAFVAVSGGVISVSDVRVDVSGSGSCVGLFSDTNSTIRVGNRVDVTRTSIPQYGAGFFSRGMSIKAVGGSPQDFSWPDIKGTDRVLFRLISAGGTPTPYSPPYTITPGVKFTVTFAAGDTSSYEPIIV
ncbi:MAG TPA: right-handed parallel beta-helix repeat-containing protein [Bryobacteraceae bacterium]|nr:right-handed parallel beta-helix repeat-containing protein [Bryobacteraceae bacterium]